MWRRLCFRLFLQLYGYVAHIIDHQLHILNVLLQELLFLRFCHGSNHRREQPSAH